MSAEFDRETSQFLRQATVFAMDLAHDAGEKVLPLFDERKFAIKNGESIEKMTTQGDRVAHETIKSRLECREDFGFPLLSEESGNEADMHELAESQGYVWVWDEIDGTYNYSRGIEIWGVSGALVKNLQPLVGVIYLPAFKMLYFGYKSGGAYRLSTSNGTPKFCGSFSEENRLSVSKTVNLHEASALYAYPTNDLKQQNRALDLIKRLMRPASPPVFKSVRRSGSTAVNLCWIAQGSADVYVGNAQESKDIYWNGPWDIAAGMLLVEEAGGRFTDYQGNNNGIRTLDRLVTNGLLHDEMLAMLKDI
ncbi:inositol monophosphatase [Candidatus Woesearchaeota archaeon]|nr:inositol monophosphatase [Candidatus Woesearchaeota archaeon]